MRGIRRGQGDYSANRRQLVRYRVSVVLQRDGRFGDGDRLNSAS